MSLKSDYRTASSEGARSVAEQQWQDVLAYLRDRHDLIPGATLKEIAEARNWTPEHTKIVLWNMLDRALIRRDGDCMDEALFFPV